MVLYQRTEVRAQRLNLRKQWTRNSRDSRELVDVETFYASQKNEDYSPLAYISARTFYSEDPNTIIRGLMLSNGGMLISELNIIGGETGREARLVIVSPPRLKNQGVTVLRDATDGQVSARIHHVEYFKHVSNSG